MKLPVAFDHHVYFVGFLVTVVPHQAVPGVVKIGLAYLRYNIVLQNCAVYCAVREYLRGAVSRQIRDKTCVKEVHLGSLYGAFQQVV